MRTALRGGRRGRRGAAKMVFGDLADKAVRALLGGILFNVGGRGHIGKMRVPTCSSVSCRYALPAPLGT